MKTAPSAYPIPSSPIKPVEILLLEQAVSINGAVFAQTMTPGDLQALTDRIVRCIQEIVQVVQRSQSLDVNEKTLRELLGELARPGLTVYQRFFSQPARHRLAEILQEIEAREAIVPSPSFLHLPNAPSFPWELLYEGKPFQDADPSLFWAARYALGRRFMGIPFHDYAHPPWDMLVCLDDALPSTRSERTALEKLIAATPQGHFRLLESQAKTAGIDNSLSLLEYLDQVPHNLLHFACRVESQPEEGATLLMSLPNCGDNRTTQIFELPATDLALVQAQVQLERHPLVYLGLRESHTEWNPRQTTFNLARRFLGLGAAAVVTPICPMPDHFAAAFATQFYQYFLLAHLPIGEALRRARVYFLHEHHNPLGFAYALFGSAHYQMS
jgi:hypothetical protein